MLTLSLLLTTDLRAAESLSRVRYLMGTTCEIVSDGSAQSAEKAFEEIERVERLISTWRDDSEISLLNRRESAGPTSVSPELFGLLRSAVEWSRRTGLAFNPLIGPLIEVWHVRGGGAWPGDAEVESARRRSGLDRIALDPSTGSVRLTAGSAIEEGAFGKGYALDRAMLLLERRGCTACVIDFGGQVSVRSATPVSIAIANPQFRQREAVTLTVGSASISTTSGSEKWFDTPAGRRSHLIDPRTGRALPPRGSVTVIHESAFVADLLSTALYVMGPDDGRRWADANDIAAIYIVPAGERWSVLTSSAGNHPSLGLTSVSADVQLKGRSLNVP